MRGPTPLLATAAVSLITLGAISAVGAMAATDPPPRIAIVARGDGSNFADALAIGSIAGQLAAPVFTTPSTLLSEAAADGLAAYDPDLVIIVGGTAALSEDVRLGILDATALTADSVHRVAGANRYETAARIATLVEDLGLSVAFLPIDGEAMRAVSADTADDADRLDGLDSSAFARAPVPTEQLLLCGVDDWRIHPSNIAEFGDPQSDVVTYDYAPDGWGMNAYQSPGSTKVRCTIHLPAGSTLTTVDVLARDFDGYWLPGCTSRLQDFTGAEDTVTALATSGDSQALSGNFVFDVSPAQPIVVGDAAVLSVDCQFQPMTGAPRDLGYRGVRATVTTDQIP